MQPLISAALASVLLQAAAMVTAISVLLGAVIAGARIGPTRWVFHQLVGGPVMAWLHGQIDKHIEPIRQELTPNGGGTFRDLWEKDRRETKEALDRLDTRTSETQELFQQAVKLYVDNYPKQEDQS